MSKLFDELTALKEAYDTKLSEEGEDALKEVFKELFEKHPRLESVTWVQYTPYFNDGDPCYFSVHDFDASINEPDVPEGTEDEDADEDEEDEDLYDDDYTYGERLSTIAKSDDPELQKLAEAVGELNGEIPEDVLESVFGDHCKVTATRDGFGITEYEHD